MENTVQHISDIWRWFYHCCKRSRCLYDVISSLVTVTLQFHGVTGVMCRSPLISQSALCCKRIIWAEYEKKTLAGFPEPLEKSWKPGKWKKKHFPDLEKSWNLKKPQKPGKIMEFGKINLEKSWNFVSDLKLSESNFSRAMRAFHVWYTIFVHFIVVHWFYPVINRVHGLIWCCASLFLFIIIRYLYHGKTERGKAFGNNSRNKAMCLSPKGISTDSGKYGGHTKGYSVRPLVHSFIDSNFHWLWI